MSNADELRIRRAEIERILAHVRHQRHTWAEEDAAGTSLRDRAKAALFSAVTRRWSTRVEQVCIALESEVVRLRSEEQRTALGPKKGLLHRLGL